ncbi:xanthine phosphoribosyltransferase [Gorillibacterium timonense]|uniref:xanthine phosphoribosyltransferase n=1 Tax=Gorillibacterium timonense TaxID=1689269 RepID=UPI00071DECA3|nr:xanthine phosphoribosyltransferase [Gorillibacterium timonense]
MELLKERIRREGVVLSNDVLKLDAVLNHQVDPHLIMEMGKEFARRFREERVTKVVTIESSGIPIAFATACELGVPMVFARRKKTLTTDQDCYCERVPSFTKGIVTDIMISKSFLSENDRVLVIDDIIANGDAARGVIRIIAQSGADIAGFGVAVEKDFQQGARTIRELGVRLDSLVKILRLEPGHIVMED